MKKSTKRIAALLLVIAIAMTQCIAVAAKEKTLITGFYDMFQYTSEDGANSVTVDGTKDTTINMVFKSLTYGSDNKIGDETVPGLLSALQAQLPLHEIGTATGTTAAYKNKGTVSSFNKDEGTENATEGVYFTLTNIGSPTLKLEGTNYASMSNRQIVYVDSTFTNTCKKGDGLVSGTYKVDKDTPTGDYLLSFKLQKMNDPNLAFAKYTTYYAVIHVTNNTKCKHNVTKTEEQSATCTTDGTKAYWYCENCQTYFSDEACENAIGDAAALEVWKANDGKIPATKHKLTKTEEQPATCTADGTMAYWYCTPCQTYFSDEACENAIGDENALEVWKANDGKIAATGHKLTKTEEQPATSTDNGTKAYWYCDKCQTYFSDADGKNKIGNEKDLELWKDGDGKIPKTEESDIEESSKDESSKEESIIEESSRSESSEESIIEEPSEDPIIEESSKDESSKEESSIEESSRSESSEEPIIEESSRSESSENPIIEESSENESRQESISEIEESSQNEISEGESISEDNSSSQEESQQTNVSGNNSQQTSTSGNASETSNAQSGNTPNTGDNTHAIPWIVLTVVSATAVVAFGRKKVK